MARYKFYIVLYCIVLLNILNVHLRSVLRHFSLIRHNRTRLCINL